MLVDIKSTLDYPQRLSGKVLPLPPHALNDAEFATAFLKAQGLKGANLEKSVTRMTAAGAVDNERHDLFPDTDLPWERAALGWHVRAWGRWILKEARRELSARYPLYAEWQTMDGTAPLERKPLELLPNQPGDDAVATLNTGISEIDLRNPKTPRWVAKPTVAYLWARTVTCKACRATIPLLKTRWLCKTDTRRVLLEMRPNSARDGVEFSVTGDLPKPTGTAAQQKATYKALGAGTMSRTGVKCPCCGGVMKMEDLRYEGQAGRLGAILTAVAVDGPAGKEFRRPTPQELAVAEVSAAEIEEAFSDVPFGVPRDPLPSKEAPGIRLPLYGFKVWSDLFSPRQLLALGTLVRLIRTLPDTLERFGYAEDWRIAIQALNVCGFSRLLDFLNTGVQWKVDVPTINHSFARFALPITWDFAEANVVGDRAGSYLLCLDRVATAVDTLDRWALKPEGITITRGSALGVVGEFDAIITDPPYYDAIPYSDIMDFFYVWLRRCLFGMSSEMDAAFANELGPKWDHEAGDGELIDDSSRFGGDAKLSKKNFEDGMAGVFRQCHASLKPNGILVIVFANKSPDAWETLVGALIRAGFVVDGSLPIQTEQSSRMRAISSAALSSSVWLVCRKRPSTARPGFAVPVLTEMREKIRTQMRSFWDAGIRGPDFVWAATGPALEAYSRHPVVRRETSTTGQPEPLPVAEFLREVRRLVVEFAVGRVLKPSEAGGDDPGGLDDVTTYYILHRDSFGMAEAPIGGCILYAMSCGLSDAELADRHEILARTGGKTEVVEDDEDEDGAEEDEAPQSEGTGSKVRLRRWDQRKRKTLGFEGIGGRPVPLIDRAHRLMQLWKAGDVAKVNAFLDQAGLARDALFALLIQALIELANRDGKGDEAAILESISNHLRSRVGVSSSAQSLLL